jgi:predicted nucleic-acid-binding protein
MIGFDTNLLLRLILNDDPMQAGQVRALLAEAQASGQVVFLPAGVLLETVWVLRRRNRVPKAEVVAFLTDLLGASDFAVGEREVVARAVAGWDAGAGDFAEYLFKEQAMAAGATTFATFDTAVQGEAGFSSP